MNVLFLTLLDFSSISERGIYTDLLREFNKNGHRIWVVSPTEKRKGQQTRIINEDNTSILKLRIGNIQKTGLIEKGITTITLESKFKNAIKRHFAGIKFDLILYSTPPITFLDTVKYIKKRDSAKTYLLLKDIFPQNAVDLGILKKTGLKGIIYRYFRDKEIKLYEISDHIGCMSQANVEYILKYNASISKDKVRVCPNSIEPKFSELTSEEKHQIRNKYELPLDKTVFIYGGNLGKPQGIQFIIDCLKLNEKNIESFILIIGSGTEYFRLKRYFDIYKPKNSKLISEVQKDEYDLLVKSSDVGLIFLDYKFTIPNFPSRILSYMEASLPILAATDVNTDMKDLIINERIGFWCDSANSERFNYLLNLLIEIELRIILGEASREFLEKKFISKKSYEIIKISVNLP